MPIKESLGLKETIELCEAICFDYANQCKDDEDKSNYIKYNELGSCFRNLRAAHVGPRSVTKIDLTVHS